MPDLQAGEAARLGARLIADDLARLGITADCMPVLDLPVAGADLVIGDRAYGGDPDRVQHLARAVCDGLIEGGVLPILKHIPGHGRARVDSHYACPVVTIADHELSRTDFAPFRALAAMPWAMTAHIVYRALDPAAPATFSRTMIGEIIRGEIGFGGVLISDDLSMRALGGALGERVRRALGAGCDLVLHCNGDRGRDGGSRRRGDAVDAGGGGAIGARRGDAPSARRIRSPGSGAPLRRIARGGAAVNGAAMAATIYQASTWVLPVVLAVTFHEAAHGFVALRFGDDTALRARRVTFNPFNHIDPFGTVILPALLLLGSGGRLLFGYAKPVPVNFNRLRDPRHDMVWVALAGPGTNVLLAIASSLLFYGVVFFPPSPADWIAANLVHSLQINAALCVFNMLPLPPLDGGRVAVGLLPRALAYPLARLEPYGIPILLVLLFVLPWVGGQIGVNLNILTYVIGVPMQALIHFVLAVTGQAG